MVLAAAVDVALEAALTAVVAGIDPLQLSESATDADFDRLVDATDAQVQWLDACYRQKEHVGRAAKHVMDAVAGSSPFLAEDKQRRFRESRHNLTSRANEIRFLNPSGRYRIYDPATASDWAEHFQWLYERRRRHELWTHWSPVLLITDPAADLDDDWLQAVDPLSSNRITTDEITSVKGLEYQHVILVIGRTLNATLTGGFTGSGQAAYGRYTLLRVAFSPAVAAGSKPTPQVVSSTSDPTVNGSRARLIGRRGRTAQPRVADPVQPGGGIQER